jgi:hypothetical protein
MSDITILIISDEHILLLRFLALIYTPASSVAPNAVLWCYFNIYGAAQHIGIIRT